MKFPLLFSLLFFINFNTSCQTTIENSSLSFNEIYEKATEDYYNKITNSSFYDKALNNCPDIKKYPKLLMYKGIDLYFSNQNILAIKYLELAKLYVNEQEDIINIKHNLSLIYLDLDQHEKAICYLKENLKKATEIDNEFYKTESYFNLLIENYNNSDARTQLKKFWSFYNNLKEKTEDDKLLYLNIFFEYLNDRNLFNESIKFKKYINKNFALDSVDVNNLSFFNSNNAFLHLGLKEYETALKYNDNFYKISKNHFGLGDVLEGLKIYRDIYKSNNKLGITLKYVDSIQTIEKELRKTSIKTSLETIDENILFEKTKNNIENKLKNYKITIIVLCLAAVILLILFLLRNKRQKEKLQKINKELKINKGKYNKSLKENIAFKKDIKDLLKSKKFNEISKLHREHEINDLNNDTYIEYLASEIENTFLNKLEKHTFTFSDIEKLVLYFRKHNHTYKEIALITGRSLRSIQSLSYRLNKKIQTKTGLELSIFLDKL